MSVFICYFEKPRPLSGSNHALYRQVGHFQAPALFHSGQVTLLTHDGKSINAVSFTDGISSSTFYRFTGPEKTRGHLFRQTLSQFISGRIENPCIVSFLYIFILHHSEMEITLPPKSSAIQPADLDALFQNNIFSGLYQIQKQPPGHDSDQTFPTPSKTRFE
jgi:hypothetical protein